MVRLNFYAWHEYVHWHCNQESRIFCKMGLRRGTQSGRRCSSPHAPLPTSLESSAWFILKRKSQITHYTHATAATTRAAGDNTDTTTCWFSILTKQTKHAILYQGNPESKSISFNNPHNPNIIGRSVLSIHFAFYLKQHASANLIQKVICDLIV